MAKKKSQAWEKLYKNFPRMNNKGQADLIGNLLEFIKTQTWILYIIWFAFIFVSSYRLNLGGVEFSLSENILTPILEPAFGVLGIYFTWDLFVIFNMVFIFVLFVLKFGSAVTK